MRRRARPLLAVPLMMAACASSKAAPEPVAPMVVKPKPSEPPEVARWAELTEELATQLRMASACSGVARAMTTFVDLHHAELAPAYKALAAWEKATAEHLVARFYDKHFAAIEVRIDAGIRCKDDKATVTAYDRFFAAAGLDLR